MRSSILLSAAFAAGSLASPLFKRAYVTEVVEVVVTQYVTEGDAAPTKEREFVEVAPAATTVYRKFGEERPPKVEPSPVIVTVTQAPVAEPSTPPVVAPEPVKTTIVQEAAAPKPTPSQAPAPQQPVSVDAATLAKLTSGPDYQAMVIRHHNFHRANHSVADLSWDNDLASKALNDAQNHGTFSHTNAGQNLYWSSGDKNSNARVSAAISDGWYNNELPLYAPYWGQEISKKTFETGGFGHMTQMIWPTTKKCGCATAWRSGSSFKGDDGKAMEGWFTVCNYDTGNVLGAFSTLTPPGKLAAVSWLA